MFKRFVFLVAILGTVNFAVGCSSTGQKACPNGNDGGAGDLGAEAEALPCLSDDYYYFTMMMHMSADRTIRIRTLEISMGWLARGGHGEMVGRLLAEDGTVLDEYRDLDPMLCSGSSCPPYPHAVDFHLHIHMRAGAAFYELTDIVSGNPPIQIDLRGHVQLFCMNAACTLDVCRPLFLDGGRPDSSDRDGGSAKGDSLNVERE